MTGSFVNRIGNSPEEGFKSPCVTISLTNITLAGEQTIDGTDVDAGDRVIVAGQTDAAENGIYDVSAGSWTRAFDFNKADDVLSGVMALAVDINTVYQAQFAGVYEPDVTEVTWVPVFTLDDPAFGVVAVAGEDDVEAATLSDTLTLVAGDNITLTTDAGTKSITIDAAGGGGTAEKGIGAGVDDVDDGDSFTGGTLDIDFAIRAFVIPSLSSDVAFRFSVPADPDRIHTVHVYIIDSNGNDWSLLYNDGEDDIDITGDFPWWDWGSNTGSTAWADPPSPLEPTGATEANIHLFEFWYIPGLSSSEFEPAGGAPFSWTGRYGRFTIGY